MCGLAGIVEPNGLDRAFAEPRLRNAIARLRPRGPDADGMWFDARCGFAHTRLKIIDLSDQAAQPMARHKGVLIFNGEIYNFAALRAELEQTGTRFESRSDSEVLLAGWRQWGAALLPRLVGMFAFAVWNPARQSLFLARDRFGKKPLLYAHDNGRLSFASDLVALDRLRDGADGIDPAALGLLFSLRFLPEPCSIRSGVRKLPPGHCLTYAGDGIHVTRWYDLARERAAPSEDPDAALRDRFDTAVADRLVADVPVGVFLSGGIDSALVAAAMVRRSERVRSFTVGFDGAAPYYEERPAARAVAAHLGTDHTEIAVAATDCLTAIDQVFDGLDEPFADSSAIPMFILAREARRHVTVALSGDGADEVFGGYRKYRAEQYAKRYQSLPAWLRRSVIEPMARQLPESKTTPMRERFRRLRRFVAHAGKSAVARQAGFYQLLDPDTLNLLLGDAVAPPDLVAMVGDLREATHSEDPINAMLGADIALGLPSDMLVKVDRMSMANSLEVRCPFLDHRLVALAAALPGSAKIGGAGNKLILKQAFADRLPAKVFGRPKKGFEVPIATWLTGPLQDLTRRAIDPDRLRRDGLFRPELPQKWYDDLKARRRDTSEALWTLVAFQAWADRHGAVNRAALAAG